MKLAELRERGQGGLDREREERWSRPSARLREGEDFHFPIFIF